MSSNSYRIRTTVGGGENVINVNLKQKVKTLNILSLEIEPEDEYDIHMSDYGVIVGRVLANNAFGVPNVKVSVFIPISSDDESDYVISNEYPYKTPQSKDINGVKYNLVLKKKDGPGTFVDKNTMLDNEGYREVYDKYWTYTTTTNQSGDYMIFGVPTGSTQIHYDCDLSDIGMLSQHPYDLIAKGYDANLFDSMNEFTAKDLNSAVHIISQDKTVYVYPFWGDKNANKIGITRADIDLNYKFEPSCVFMGSSITDPRGSYIGIDGQPNGSNGRFNSLSTSIGDIEIIRKTQDGRVEELRENVVGIIDGNGVWCYQIPMNLDRIGTDEFGNMTVVNDPERGIPTRARVRFRISLTDAKDESASEYTAKFLIPCNPPLETKNETSRSATINYEAFSEDDWDNIYEFGDKTPDSCFRDLYWGKVYSVKQYYLRYQYEYEPKIVGYGDSMTYDTNEDFNKPDLGYTFKEFPYVGDNTDIDDRRKAQRSNYDYSNYPTRNAFKVSCISSIDKINGLNPFPYNTMYAGAEEHINDGTLYWFRYHFTNESSDSSYASKGLHFCFENDWINGCLYFPRILIKRRNEEDYDYFGSVNDKTIGEDSVVNEYSPYVWISGRHNYRLQDYRQQEGNEDKDDKFYLHNNLKDFFSSRWVAGSDDDDDDTQLVNWQYTPVFEALFYAFSRCRMLGGTVTKKKTMIGQDVFYYRCGNLGHQAIYETIDLNLPSGTLWAKYNLGAKSITGVGNYYQWGDYQYKQSKNYDKDHYMWFIDGEDSEAGYENRYTKYCWRDNKTVLDSEDDAVYAATNGEMVMPTKKQLEELIEHTNHEWTTIGNVKGMKFWKKDTDNPDVEDENSYLFIPAGGYYDGTNLEDSSAGYIWSASHGSNHDYNALGLKMFTENHEGKANFWVDQRYFGLPLRGVSNSKYNSQTKDVFQRMYATDIILLGNLEDVYDSLPKLYESLPSTTATFPPMSPPETLSEAGMTWAGYASQLDRLMKEGTWDDRCDIFGNEPTDFRKFLFDHESVKGYESPQAQTFLTEAESVVSSAYDNHQYDNYNRDDNYYIYSREDSEGISQNLYGSILLGMLNRRYSLFFGIMNSGGISAFLSYVPAAFVNLSRLCELDVHNDSAFSVRVGDGQSDNIIVPINGIIDAFDITTNENRSHFASMNYDITKREKNDFVYKQYVTTPMSVSSFDGRLQMLIDETKTYGLLYPKDDIDKVYMEFRFKNPYMSEGNRRVMRNFRAYFGNKDFPMSYEVAQRESNWSDLEDRVYKTNYCNDHIVLTENSFYFYFGLRTGFSAIDVLRNKFIGKLKEEKHTINQLTVIRGQQECVNENLYISYSLTSRDMTLPIEVYVYNKDNNLVFFQEYGSTSDPITFSVVPGIYHVIVVDSLGKQYQKYFSAIEEELPIGAIGYFEKEKDNESHLVDVSELTLNTINNLPIISIEESGSGNYIAYTDSDSQYFVTFEGGGVSSVTGNVVRFNDKISGITIKVTDYNATCFKGETYVTFKEHINPQLFLNNVPIMYINYWSGDGSGYTIENGVPDYVFKNANFKVWDSINTAHPYRSNRTYSDALKENLNNEFNSVSIAYVSNMCSSVFGGSAISLQDANHSSNYRVQGIYLNYNESKYELPRENWGQETQLTPGIQRAVVNGVEPNTESFRNAPHIIGTNYPRRKNLASQKTFLKNSALNPDGSLGESGYTNNQLYSNHSYGSRNANADSYFGNGIFGIYLLGLRYKTFSELDEPGPLFSVPKVTGNTISSYYLVNNSTYRGVTNYYGIRTVDKRMDYQFALKTPLLLPSGIESFQNLEYNNLVSGEMRVHLYGGFRLNYDKADMKLDYNQGQGPDFDADLYSVTITEDDTEEMLSYSQTKQCIWGYTQSEASGATDVDYEVYDISGNTIHGHSKIQLTFTDCSTSFKLGEPVRQGNSEKFSVSYQTPIQILPSDRSKACHISYVIRLGSQNYESKLESLPFSVKGDSLWPGETYTHSNTNGQTYYENGCDDAVYAATKGKMRIPTKNQMEELLKGTVHEWTEIDGIFGAKFWKKEEEEPTDEGSYLFIPAGGYLADDIYQEENSSVCVWSSTRDDENENLALSLNYTESEEREYERYYGLNLRGVAPSGYTGSDVVDLGLSVKWAKCNFGAASKTDLGGYYQWGDVNGYKNNESSNNFSWDSYIFGVNPNKYNDTDNIYVLTEEDDAVYKATNGEMIMPEMTQMVELLDETEHRWTSIGNVNGVKFWKKGEEEPDDEGSYLFIPAGGYFKDGERYGINAQLRLWSSERFSDNYKQSYIISGDSGSATTCSIDTTDRCLGFNLRGVAYSIDSQEDFVDLSLPSGTLWAKCNLGETNETDFGKYYQWGDVNGDRDVFHKFNCADYLWTCNPQKYNQVDFVCNLQSEDDAVYMATNEVMRIPTKEQMEELLEKTDYKQDWTYIDGVKGVKFWKKGEEEPDDEGSYLFIPVGGFYENTKYNGDSVDVWTSSRDGEYDKNAYRLKVYYDVDRHQVSYECIGHNGDNIDCGYGLNLRGVAPSGYTGSDVVDLGLSVKWAKCNLGATSKTGFGKYYQWANTSGYTPSEIGVGGYNFDITEHPLYDSVRETLKKYGNYYFMFQLEDCDDVIYVTTNGKMRIPTKEQMVELLEKTDYKQETISGTTGVKFWKKDTVEPADEDSYLFIPAGGYFKDGERYDKESYVCLWSNCCDISDYKKASGLYISSPASLKADMRYYGLNVRGVAPSGYTGSDVVDFGLSVKWAKYNLGATSENVFGKYYQWGDVNGYASGYYHNFDNKDYIWGSGDEYGGVTKYNSDDNKKQLDTKTYLPWVQTYADTIPYSEEGNSDISVYLCQPMDNTTYNVSQSLKVAYERSGATYFDSDRFIVPYYKSQDKTMTPINDANANGRYKYSTDTSNATLSEDTFIVIPTKTVYSTMTSTRPSLSTLLKQGVSYNVGSAYFAGGVSHSWISNNVVTVQLNTPLRRSDGTIDYESTSLKEGAKWHTIGNISQWWSDTGEISYDPNKIEFTYKREQINPSDVFYFSIENGLTYQVTLIFQENAVQDSTEPEA